MTTMTLFEWTEEKAFEYGKYGMLYRCYVSDMHIGTVRVVQAELLTPSIVTAIMHKKTENIVRCEDPSNKIGQGKAWIESEFMEWFLAVNKLAWAYVRERQGLPDGG